tara:strand:+ start:156 stop:617 length:462 start_codon:yes stop_codon:yes gene_type:complete
MKNIKKIFALMLILLITSCGYEPLFSSKNSDFAIYNVDYLGEKKLNSQINNSLKIYKDTKNKKNIYSAKIKTTKKKSIVTKDTKGNAKIYLIEIDVELKIYENGNLKNTKIFKERFNYNNSSNKFQLKQYEKNIQSNLINEIIKGITLYLYSI